jgi:hypothetical protein
LDGKTGQSWHRQRASSNRVHGGSVLIPPVRLIMAHHEANLMEVRLARWNANTSFTNTTTTMIRPLLLPHVDYALSEMCISSSSFRLRTNLVPVLRTVSVENPHPIPSHLDIEASPHCLSVTGCRGVHGDCVGGGGAVVTQAKQGASRSFYVTDYGYRLR